MSIPVENIYYLLCYAWRHVQERQRVPAGTERFGRISDLLGHVLAGAVAGLIKSGLDRNYVAVEGAIPGIRGKLDITQTFQKQLMSGGRAYCHFDEFHHDIPANRIIKATLRLMLTVPYLDPEVRGRLRAVVLHLKDITDIRLQARDFSSVPIHSNNKGYDFVLRLCSLAFANVNANRQDGRSYFHDFATDEAQMGQVFEDFLFNFFRHEQKDFGVSRPHIKWHDAVGSEHDLAYLPIMRTDILLRRAGHMLVIDAKYYREALVARFTADKVRSGHLYQIFTYLENLRQAADGAVVEGMLLYPVVKERFVFDYRLHGMRIRVATVDLDQSWQRIHNDLLALIRN